MMFPAIYSHKGFSVRHFLNPQRTLPSCAQHWALPQNKYCTEKIRPIIIRIKSSNAGIWRGKISHEGANAMQLIWCKQQRVGKGHLAWGVCNKEGLEKNTLQGLKIVQSCFFFP